MQRIAFKMNVKPEKVEEYIEAHRHVPTNLIELYRSAGIRNLTVFLRGSELFLCLECDDSRRPKTDWKIILPKNAGRLRWPN